MYAIRSYYGSVEGAAHHPAAGTGGQLAGAVEHLLGCPAGEGQEQDRFRRNALLDQIGHTVDKGPGFPGTGTGDDQYRAFAVGGRGILGRVEHLRGDSALRMGWAGFGWRLVVEKKMALHSRFSTTAGDVLQWC